MKLSIVASLFAASVMAASCGNMDTNALMAGGVQAVQAMTLSDSDVRAYVSEYIAQLDAQSVVLPEQGLRR